MRSALFKKLVCFIGLISILLFTGVTNAATPEVGKSYYTKHGFMFEKGRHVTTNYWRGEYVPVNSLVEVKSIKRKKMVLTYNGQDITITNVAKHTLKSMEEIGDRLLSGSSVKVSGKFSDSIRSGQMRLGMTKDQIIMTRGYPPAHKTSSTQANQWTYWSSKFVQRTLVFQNGVLKAGRGLR